MGTAHQAPYRRKPVSISHFHCKTLSLSSNKVAAIRHRNVVLSPIFSGTNVSQIPLIALCHRTVCTGGFSRKRNPPAIFSFLSLKANTPEAAAEGTFDLSQNVLAAVVMYHAGGNPVIRNTIIVSAGKLLGYRGILPLKDKRPLMTGWVCCFCESRRY